MVKFRLSLLLRLLLIVLVFTHAVAVVTAREGERERERSFARSFSILLRPSRCNLAPFVSPENPQRGRKKSDTHTSNTGLRLLKPVLM